MMDLLKFVCVQAATGRKTTSVYGHLSLDSKGNMQHFPVRAIEDYDGVNYNISGAENAAPVLYVFFKKGKYHEAMVAADNQVLDLQATSPVMAIITYLATYYCFGIPYASKHEPFLNFLQYAFIGDTRMQGKSTTQVSFNKFKATFDEAMAAMDNDDAIDA